MRKRRAMLLQSRCAPEKTAPAQNQCNLTPPDNRDPGHCIKKRHGCDPPVHTLPGPIEQSAYRRSQSANLGLPIQIPHFTLLFSSAENGSESVRRFRILEVRVATFCESASESVRSRDI